MNRRRLLACLAAASPLARAGTPPRDVFADAREKGLQFLRDRQSVDGAWRSKVYGAFRSGEALTAPTALAVDRADPGAAAVARARDWFDANVQGQIFPVHTMAARLKLSGGRPGAKRALELVRRLQIGSGGERGWQAVHPAFGGWSYSHEPAPYADPLPAMSVPNVAATATALEGIGGLNGLRTDRERGCRFLLQHQNPDGGFFQILDDPTRNKAGTERDAEGRLLAKSYTAATLDGLRGLLASGWDWSAAPVASATAWLEELGDPLDVGDLRYYSLRQAAWLGSREEADPCLQTKIHGWLRAALDQQAEDGSWSNPLGEMREDDPIVATAYLVEALARLGG